MGASLALAGLTACTKQPTEKIVPYVQPPEELVPGPAALLRDRACPTAATRRASWSRATMGRPTKIEGNPEHPASLGATDIFGQAHDPRPLRPRPLADRAATYGEIRTWADFLRGARGAPLGKQQARSRARASASSPDASPRRRSPRRSRTLLAGVARGALASVRAGRAATTRARARVLAFGEAVEARYHFDQADVILSLDADFLGDGPGEPARSSASSRARRKVPARAAAR